MLLGLVIVGGIVRVIACLALWPVATTLSDSATYAVDAATNPLADPLHPAGYGAVLALLGTVTRDVAVTVLLQHALGIAAALLLYAAVRRIVGSPWPALVPAAVVLLNTDEIFLEHSVMSEGPFLFILTVALYAVVRAIDAQANARARWSAIAGAAVATAVVLRSAGLFAVPPLGLAIALGRPPLAGGRWRGSALFLSVVAILLAGYATANRATNGRFEITPAIGWHLYARVGRFADCRQLVPPRGTARLCERVPPPQRGWGPDFYLYTSKSPARRVFGPFPNDDGKVGSFAIQVVLHQPADMAEAFWVDVRRYFVPSDRPHGWYTGWDIDPQLEWGRQGGPAYTRETLSGMRRFFNRFVPQRNPALIAVLGGYEQLFGFGATLLTVCSLLTLVGLFVGSRRNRVGVLLFGVCGLAQLICPTAVVLYMGRYVIPVAGLIAAGAAISAWSLLDGLRRHPRYATIRRRLVG